MADRPPQSLWRVQLALECKAFDDAGRLVVTPGPDPDPLDDCYAVRYSDGATEIAFAASAPDPFVQQLGQYRVDAIVDQRHTVVEQLRTVGFRVSIGHFHTYAFGDQPSGTKPSNLIRDATESFSLVIDRHRVATASSARSDDAAAELWIETDPGHRRRGYATIIAEAWADEVLQGGKIAFYSHLHDNLASAALAGRLGVRPLFEIVALSVEPSSPAAERGSRGIPAR